MINSARLILYGIFDGINTCTPANANNGDCTPPGVDDVAILISNVTTIALGLIGTVALLFFIYGGITYMTSGGNPDQIMKAKNILLYSIVGIVLAIASWAIISFIMGLF